MYHRLNIMGRLETFLKCFKKNNARQLRKQKKTCFFITCVNRIFSLSSEEQVSELYWQYCIQQLLTFAFLSLKLKLMCSIKSVQKNTEFQRSVCNLRGHLLPDYDQVPSFTVFYIFYSISEGLLFLFSFKVLNYHDKNYHELKVGQIGCLMKCLELHLHNIFQSHSSIFTV